MLGEGSCLGGEAVSRVARGLGEVVGLHAHSVQSWGGARRLAR